MPIQRSHHAQQIHGGSGARAAGIPGALPVGNEETGRVPWVPGWGGRACSIFRFWM
jgi:hypothetical protein